MIIVLLLTSCSKERSYWEGIWRAEVEYIPGLHSNMEFDLRKNFLNGQWSGQWEAEELFSSGKIERIEITNYSINMDLGDGQLFTGTLLNDKRSLEGVLHSFRLNEINDTFKFVKVIDWTSEKPARIDKYGNAQEEWSYAIPKQLDDGWDVANLEKINTIHPPLDELFESVLDGKYKGLDAILIAHHGKLVLEEYFHLGSQNRVHAMMSCTKSVTSLLIGIAHDNKLIDNLNQPLQSFFSNYLDSLETNTWPINLEHALTMSAELDWNESEILFPDPKNDLVLMNHSSDMYSFVLTRNMANGGRIGKKFEYNSGLSILLGGVILNVAGMPADKYAEKKLFNQLGIDQYYWMSVSEQTHTGGGLWLRPRDFLKIGQMVLNNGKWKGEQVVSESWIKESTSFQISIREEDDYSYGYQWWRGQLNVDQTKYPIIWAEGYGGQFLFIVPDLDLVVAFLHHNPKDLNTTHTMAWKEMEKFIIPAVLSN